MNRPCVRKFRNISRLIFIHTVIIFMNYLGMSASFKRVELFVNRHVGGSSLLLLQPMHNSFALNIKIYIKIYRMSHSLPNSAFL